MIPSDILFSFHAISLQLGAEIPQKMFCVYVAGDELGTLTHDFRQNGFTIPVDGCHVAQLNDELPRVPCATRFSPSRLELRRPTADQLTLQRPPLLSGQIGYRDLQHCSPSTACRKPPTAEAGSPTTVWCSQQFLSQDWAVEEPKNHRAVQ